MTATPSPSPTPSDSTLNRFEENDRQRQDTQTKDQQKQKNIEKKKQEYNKLQASYLFGGSHDARGNPTSFNGLEFIDVLQKLQTRYNALKTGNYNYRDSGLFSQTHSKKETQKQYLHYKNMVLSWTKQWEKKNKMSVLDLLSYDAGLLEPRGDNGERNPQKVDKDILFVVLNDNSNSKQKFITPTRYVPNVSVQDTGAWTKPPVVNPAAVDPVTGKPPTKTVNPSGKFTFTSDVDSQGNPTYYFDANSGKIPIALIGGSTYGYYRNDPNYASSTSASGLDVNNPLVDNSPMGYGEYFNYYVTRLYKTPNGVKNLKELLISKNIIPPSAVQTVMLDPNTIDGTTQNAIYSVMSMVTAHNVARAQAKGAKAGFWSIEDFLSNMRPLDLSSTSVNTIHQKINPTDYSISIDKMFQDTIGRGANQEELDHFVKQLQSYANRNPEVTSTTTTPTQTGDTKSTSTSGGVTDSAAAAIMQQEALKQPGAEDYTKGVKYFKLFQDAINSPLQLGG